MTRTKWLALSIDLPILQIADALYERQFLRGKIAGFELSDVNKSSVRGRFIEEVIANEVVIDPFGDEILNSVRRYSIFDFQITPLKKYNFLIRINNPPRSLKNFITTLSDVFGFGFSVEPLEIDILAMIKHLRDLSSVSSWSVKKVRMSHVRLSDSSFAKVEVVSDVDAYNDFRKHMSVKGAVLERATIAPKMSNLFGDIEFVSTGVVICDTNALEELSPILQSYFQLAMI